MEKLISFLEFDIKYIGQDGFTAYAENVEGINTGGNIRKFIVQLIHDKKMKL